MKAVLIFVLCYVAYVLYGGVVLIGHAQTIAQQQQAAVANAMK